MGLHGAHRLRLAYGLGIAGYASGLALSAILDLPSGAVIVCSLAGCAAAAAATRMSLARQAGARP